MENSVRFHDNLTESHFKNVNYNDVTFRGICILAQQEKTQKMYMIAAAFTGWQFICTQIQNPPTWNKYIKNLGLAEKESRVTKEDLKREADQAMANVERIRARFRKAKNK